MSSKIAPELRERGLVVAVTELTTHPHNSNLGNTNAIARSLDYHGQVRPILANNEGVVVAGNHTLLAARDDLGWDEIAVVTRAFISPQDERAYLEADNRIARLAQEDMEKVVENIDFAVQGGVPLDAVGHTEDSIDDMLDMLAAEAMLNQIPEAGYAETDEQRDARDKSETYRQGIEPKVEIMLMMTVPERVEFVGYLAVLRKAYGIDSAKDCVFKCVKETATVFDTVETIKAKQEEEQKGSVTPNEARAEQGLPPIAPEQQDDSE